MIKASLSLRDNTWAFAEVLDDVMNKDRVGKSVIIYPRSFIESITSDDPLPAYFQAIKDIIEDFFEAGVIIVTCAGNGGSQRSVDTAHAS